MARAATTSDAFNAVAEPRRRQILTCLVQTERPVGDIVTGLKLDQPSMSKHLGVLRRVGLVHMRCDGRHKEGLAHTMSWVRHHDKYEDSYLVNPTEPYIPPAKVSGSCCSGEHHD